MTTSRTKFIQDAFVTPFTRIVVDTPPYDLMFYWMFYQRDNLYKQFEISTNKLVKEIYPALLEMPRDIQLKLIMKILKEPEIDHSKKVQAVVKLYT